MSPSQSESEQVTVTIANHLGLHARPAMAFVDAANAFKSEIRIYRDDRNDNGVDGKSIMQVMMLAATHGTSLTIRARGPDATDALQTLRKLVESKFDED
ncbi:MAG: HPr family phosphocarrier protein [Phycisphaeraceae bacterium]|nr:HPr family phosphocarrier protein [Phycisphaeraceae bacterium]